MIADEHDGFYTGLRAFIDLEDNVDAAIGEIDDSVGDIGGGLAGTTIEILDALDVRIDDRLVERPMCFRLDFAGELIGLDLAVALEGDTVDQVVLFDADDDLTADMADLNVGEQTCRVEILDALVDGRGIGTREVGLDCFCVDSAVSLDDDTCSQSGRHC